MGLLDKLTGKKEEPKKPKTEEELFGKYKEACAMCGGSGTDKKWAGQYWHKKCLRGAKKGAKKML
ncbi:MAG: hypothetical protein COV47_00675 [Candidatus Diapherotrites archaeon CG11_big_fil_rev_8_21_14_0_20_37_9]|nr:MAG: hypothetical protein COV47_00675 [Candidatus Diapherotrites archaeon CG11_big_fil_rev_8_21_14_0_20_37_9]